MNVITGTQTEFEIVMCDAAVQCDYCNLLEPQMTSTPKKQTAQATEDATPFEITEESEADVTESIIYQETTTSEEDEQIPLEKQMTFLVFESALMLLFSTCVACGSAFVSIKHHIMGSFLSVKQVCSQCNNSFTWESQLFISNIPAGNLLTSAAILYTGSLPAKALRIFRSLICATISILDIKRTTCIQPFMMFWEKNQMLLLSNLIKKQKGLILGGNGRSDSPGHSAKYGSCSMLELSINKIIDIKLVQV